MNFTLGTAQLGLDYGIANSSGKPDKNSAFEILNQSVKSGVRYYDTAAAYGNSEEILGEFFSSHNSDVFIITKIPPVADRKSV
ncbi:MAG TPA: aldo/keto reductase, partial [Bacteroidetes bacterium]|nr:aldo/keto reductase [Bacteroidota bacterium]